MHVGSFGFLLYVIIAIHAFQSFAQKNSTLLSRARSFLSPGPKLVTAEEYVKQVQKGLIVYEPKAAKDSGCNNPIIVVQSMLLAESPAFNKPHYHVVLSTVGKDAEMCPFIQIQIKLLKADAQVFVKDEGDKVLRKLGWKVPDSTFTNFFGRASLYIPIRTPKKSFDALAAPQLLVRTTLMKADEYLLIVPDKPVLHFLENLDVSLLKNLASADATSLEIRTAVDALSDLALHQMSAVPDIEANSSTKIFIEHDLGLFKPSMEYHSMSDYRTLMKRGQLRSYGGKTVRRKDRNMRWKKSTAFKSHLIRQMGERHYDGVRNLVSTYLVRSPEELSEDFEMSVNKLSPHFNYTFEYFDDDYRLAKRATPVKDQKMGLTRRKNRVLVWMKEKGKVRNFVVSSVRSALQVAGRVLRAIGVSLYRLFERFVQRLHIDSVLRVQAFIKHYILVRRSHIRDSLNVISGDLSEKWFSDPNKKLDALRNVSMRLGDNSVSDMLSGKTGVQFGSALVTQDPKQFFVGKQNTNDSVEMVPDVRAACLEDQVMGDFQAAFSGADESAFDSDAQTELLNEANMIVTDILDSIAADGGNMKQRLRFRNLIFRAKDNFLKRPFKSFLHTMATLFVSFKGLLQSSSERFFKSLAKLNDLYYRALDMTLLRPVLLLTKRYKRVGFLDLITMFGAPFAFYQYLSIRGVEPLSQSDLDVLLTVKNPMLFRYTWNSDNPSPELVRMRDGVLDWLPRAYMSTLTWTSVFWAHSTALVARRLPALKAHKEMTGKSFRYNLYNSMFHVLKVSRLVTSWKIGFLLGAMSYPVEQAQSASKADIEAAIGTISYSSWGMWAWWMFPVVWKTALPLTTLMKDRLIAQNPREAGDIVTYFAHAESVVTGVPMVIAFSTVLVDLWSGTDLKNPKQLYTSATSTFAWMFDGLSNFLSEPVFEGHVWSILYSMCAWYQARVTGMMFFDIVGLGDQSVYKSKLDNAAEKNVSKSIEELGAEEIERDIEQVEEPIKLSLQREAETDPVFEEVLEEAIRS